ncbi:hypothetical protein DFH08DRAFT_805034 [Mycena albidolilacea]|uniref:CxC2-like cysteine cluster KDZ transposase-associated domain-containing protein n=1 Tax=Mycena albidolilacea TaxID=1033008 RepID=A0AAD7EWD8_9AGAR|nr:hypothetical protein DFH08DRAFT_805034 [Mycena albidolilacea]
MAYPYRDGVETTILLLGPVSPLQNLSETLLWLKSLNTPQDVRRELRTMSRMKRKRKDLPVHSHTATFSLADITGNNTEIPITTYVDRVSEDGHRRYRDEVVVEPPSPVKRQRAREALPHPAPHLPPHDSFNESERYHLGFDLPEDWPLEDPPAPGPLPTKPLDPALHRFRCNRDLYLGNILRCDGFIWTEGGEVCSGCWMATGGDQPVIFRFVHAHEMADAHQQWNGQYFVSCTLKSLGLRVQLGHRPGERCSEPAPIHSSFVVLHTNRIHDVAVNTCDCERRLWAGPPEEQMLRAGWFPATDDRPRTCATMEVLDAFLLQTYQAKTTMYDYYSVLEKLTSNVGVKPPNCYHAFLRMVCEYSHLLMLKRAGRGHAKSGVLGTAQGELAVLCPCCPVPSINLPQDWESAPPGQQFLYIFIVAIDACFRLKRRLVSSWLKDPSLWPGWSYLLEQEPYRQFLLTVTDQKEMSTCSGLAALDYANTKFSRGYAATGVGMGVCTRHEFVLPNGVGDLQKGERYGNMDWIIAMILRRLDPRLCKIISYDIVCQWWKHLKERLQALPPASRVTLILALVWFAIPKMHIKGHLRGCQTTYSLNLIPGSAETDGEAIERPWAHIGGVGTSTREMGLGLREDTLNGHWGSWNWQKLVGLGERLCTKLDRANTEYADQMESFTEFSAQQAECVPGWKALVDAFEADPSAKNPYEMKVKALTEKDVLLRFEKEEAERIQNGVPGIHSVSPSSFVAAGLEVEDEQRRVRVQAELKKAGTTSQEINMITLRGSLNRSIQQLRKLQATYTPASIVALGQRVNVPDDEQPEQVPLFLPSALSTAQRSMEGVAALAVIEGAMREAQCSHALVRLRSQLHVKSRLLTYKALQARHQGTNTRARAIVERNECKIRLHSKKYQMAWEAKRWLADGDAEMVGWPPLLREDIRCMEDVEELARSAEQRKEQEAWHLQREDALRDQGELPPLTRKEQEERASRGGESVRKVLWIWTAAGLVGSDAELEEVSLEYRAREWEDRVRAVPVSAEARAEWDDTIFVHGTWTVERTEGPDAAGHCRADHHIDDGGEEGAGEEAEGGGGRLAGRRGW